MPLSHGRSVSGAALWIPALDAVYERVETSRLATMNNRALVEAFQRVGLQFIEENGGGVGSGCGIIGRNDRTDQNGLAGQFWNAVSPCVTRFRLSSTRKKWTIEST